MKMMNREHYRDRYAALRDTKREREEAKRWERFLMDRTEFDAEMQEQLDTYEFMMQSMEGRE
jgi:hypothetical protein